MAKYYRCREKSCDRKFATQRGERLHHMRVHNPHYKNKFKQNTARAGKKQKSGGDVSDYMIQVLQKHGGEMHRRDLAEAILKAGYNTNSSLGNLVNYLTQVSHNHPEHGIVSSHRGFLQLNKKASKSIKMRTGVSRASPASASTEEELPVDIELEILRRQNAKNSEIVLKMGELLMIAMS